MARILVIDDSGFQRKWIVKSLEVIGFETIEAENGAIGLETLDREKPDAVTMDINMPEMDGIQFLTALNVRGGEIPPVIVITADIQAETKKQCEELGAKAFINKPFEVDDLREALSGIFELDKLVNN